MRVERLRRQILFFGFEDRKERVFYSRDYRLAVRFSRNSELLIDVDNNGVDVNLFYDKIWMVFCRWGNCYGLDTDYWLDNLLVSSFWFWRIVANRSVEYFRFWHVRVGNDLC